MFLHRGRKSSLFRLQTPICPKPNTWNTLKICHSNSTRIDLKSKGLKKSHGWCPVYGLFLSHSHPQLPSLPPLCFNCSFSVCHKLELERQQHNQLKHTWQRANDQFLESQRLLMRDMQRIESVLSSEQLRQVEEMKKKDQVCDSLALVHNNSSWWYRRLLDVCF